MACRTLLHSVFFTEPWLPVHLCCTSVSASLRTRRPAAAAHGGNVLPIRSRNFQFTNRTRLACSSYNDSPSTLSPSSQDDQNPPQEAVLKAISEVSRAEGRVGLTTNVVIGGTVTDDSTNEWLALDQKVNSYPTDRGFTAIGTGGEDFVQSMIVAVESVIQEPIPEILSCRKRHLQCNDTSHYENMESSNLIVFPSRLMRMIWLGRVQHKLSSGGKYVSVNIGPIQVISSEQVQAVYNAMRRDDRMKYFL